MEIILLPILFQTIVTLFLIRFYVREELGISYLDIILGVFVVHLIYKAMLLSAFHNDVAHQKLHGAFTLLYGPLLMLYVKQTTFIKQRILFPSRRILWHFVPFVFVFIVNCILIVEVIYRQHFEYLEAYHLMVFGLTVISCSFYSLSVLFSRSFKHEKENSKRYITILIACLLLIPFLLGFISFFWPKFPGRTIWYISICVMMINVLVIRARAQKNTIHILKTALEAEKQRHINHKQKSYLHSKLTNDLRKDLIKHIDLLMTDEKPFLDSGLTLESLAKKLNITKHQLTEILNVDLQTNFYHYINALRVKEAMRLIRSGDFDGNLLHLCYVSGFKSKSTFNKYFKEITGSTPKEFRDTSYVNASIKLINDKVK